jgi:hypothetical protein
MFFLFSNTPNIPTLLAKFRDAVRRALPRLRVWLRTPLPRRRMWQGCATLGLGLVCAAALCISISIYTWRTFSLAACSGGAAVPAASDLVLGEYILRLRAVEWLRARLP